MRRAKNQEGVNPCLARLGCDLIELQQPRFRPCLLNLQQARQPIFLAAGLDAGVVIKLLFEKLHRLAKFGWGNLVSILPVFLQKIIEF